MGDSLPLGHLSLSRLSPPDIKDIADQLSDNPEQAIRYIKSRQVMKSKRHAAKVVPSVTPPISIKETPAYDPDASVESLIFTIPSWISAIERTAIETDYSTITPSAHLNLRNALKKLAGTAQSLLDTMEETAHEH